MTDPHADQTTDSLITLMQSCRETAEHVNRLLARTNFLLSSIANERLFQASSPGQYVGRLHPSTITTTKWVVPPID